MSATVIMSVRCHYCSKWQLPGEVHEMGTGGIHICRNCLDWHERASKFLTENVPPPGCQECGRSISDVSADKCTTARLWLVPKDGIYQVLCTECREAYEQKRADLFGPTRYGAEKGIGR
jgi:hypothetical protein